MFVCGKMFNVVKLFVSRQTQWDPPAWEGEQDDDMDLGTPTHDEPKVGNRCGDRQTDRWTV